MGLGVEGTFLEKLTEDGSNDMKLLKKKIQGKRSLTHRRHPCMSGAGGKGNNRSYLNSQKTTRGRR